jgi:hypothetical protein
MAPAGALPADVAAKAGHSLAGRHLRAAADGSPTGKELPSREALVERFLSPGGGSRRGSRRLGGPNRSIKLAAGEAIDTTMATKAPQSKGDLLQAAALAAANMEPAAADVRDVLAAAASSAFFSPSAAAPAGGKGEAAGRDRESSMHGVGEGLQARRAAALRRLVQRGFEGWGTPGGRMCVQCRQHARRGLQPQRSCLLPAPGTRAALALARCPGGRVASRRAALGSLILRCACCAAGTAPRFETKGFRILAVATQVRSRATPHQGLVHGRGSRHACAGGWCLCSSAAPRQALLTPHLMRRRCRRPCAPSPRAPGAGRRLSGVARAAHAQPWHRLHLLHPLLVRPASPLPACTAWLYCRPAWLQLPACTWLPLAAALFACF